MPNRFVLTGHSEDKLVQNQDLYARLELIAPQPRSSAIARVAAMGGRLRQWSHAALRYFVGSQEPRITTQINHDGQRVYAVYDPVDQRHHHFASEAEVRGWLDQRYYQ